MNKPIVFDRDYSTTYGDLQSLTPWLRRMTAPNPGPFTFQGTGTYVVGKGRVAVIDPGPLIDSHIEALHASLAGEVVTHILVTHRHMDHSPACERFKQLTGAPSVGYKSSPEALTRMSSADGYDKNFTPDITVADGDWIEGSDWRIECLHTPGHTSDHLCFAMPDQSALFCGDQVMGWSTSIVSPPDGNMGDYMRSLQRLLLRDEQTFWPTHGGPVADPKSLVRGLVAHRKVREQQILNSVAAGLTSIDSMIGHIYSDIDPSLYPAAARSLMAALDFLVEEGKLLPGRENGHYQSA